MQTDKTNARAVKGMGIGRVGGVDGIGIIKEDLSAEVPFTPNSEDGELTTWAKMACSANMWAVTPRKREPTMSPDRTRNEQGVPKDSREMGAKGVMVRGGPSSARCWLQT